MTNFLSFDIDFFNKSNHEPESKQPSQFQRTEALKSTLEKLTALSEKLEIPLWAVTNHQQMLGAVNASNADRLVNIDYHSDLCCADGCLRELNCGTWINYVTWRNEGKYLWIHSGTAQEGDCGELYDTAAKFRDEPGITTATLSGWNEVEDIKSRHAWRHIQRLGEILEIAVCQSPSFSEPNLIKTFNNWKNSQKIPFKKGRNDESYGRIIKPTRPKTRNRSVQLT